MMKERTMAPTTSMGEKSRSTGVDSQQTNQPHNQADWVSGKITAVDAKRPVIQVEGVAGNKLFGGKWIQLGHSVHDIVDRFGTIRVGMEVMVHYKGQFGCPVFAIAFVTGEEDEKGPNKDNADNNMAQGFHNILMENL